MQPTSDRTVEIDFDVEDGRAPGGATRVAQEGEEAQAELERYGRELDEHRRAGDTASEVKTRIWLALTYEKLNRRTEAVEQYAHVLPLLLPETQDDTKAFVLFKLGGLSRKLGLYDRAISYLEQALSLSQKLQHPKYRIFKAMIHRDLGLTYSSAGKGRQAFEQLELSRPLLEESGELTEMPYVYTLLGRTAPTHKEALDYYTLALSAFRKLNDKTGEADTLGTIAGFYGGLNERTALSYYKQALAVWEKVGNLDEQAQIHMHMGWLYAVLGDKPNSDESYRTALSIFSRSPGNLTREAEATRSLGEAALLFDNKPDAIRHLGRAASLSRAADKPADEAAALVRVSLIQAHSGQRREALETLSRVTSLIESADTRARRDGYPAFFIGLVYRLLNEPERALKFWQQALDIHRARGDQRGEAMALVAMGRTYELEGEPQRALTYYLDSIATREKVIEGARIEELKINLTENSVNAYHLAVLLAFKLGKHVQAFELSERARARALLDQLGNSRVNLRRGPSAELIAEEESLRLEVATLQKQLGGERTRPAAQRLSAAEAQALAGLLASKQREYGDLLVRLKASNPEYVSLRAVDPINLERLQALLNESTTLLSYFVTPEKTLAFVITRDSFRAVELCPDGRCVSEQELKDAITQFRGFSDLSDPHPPSLRRLYGWLVQPVRERLRTRTVCVVPHGVMHYLPFAALSDNRSFMGEKHDIYYLPSASVLPFIRQKRGTATADTLLAVAQNHAQGAPLLRHAEETARKIASRYNVQALTGSAATETAFRSRAGGASGIFISAHGKLNPLIPLFSSVALSPDAENDGLLEVHEVYELDLRVADHVVLSGCQTHLGELSRGDDVVGLNRAFFYAGSPTVIASLWSVRELQTGELMVFFYEGLGKGLSKADALLRAQALVRARHPHPYHWAAFILTGEP